ncbi:glycosyltransferase [archaeon]|nr:glycosyltransferase [archaeon]
MGLIETAQTLSTRWEIIVQKIFDQYQALGRPILDYVHIIFDDVFKIFLVVTVIASFLFLVMTIYVLINRRKEQELTGNYTPKVTVQIPTYNELVALRCAKACLNFDYPKDKYEILIGDDSSDETISDKILNFVQNYPIMKVLKREKNIGFKPGNLNNLLKHTNGEFIVIFDSDFVPPKDFLKRIVQPFAHDEKIAAVQAKWTFINQNQNLISILASTILNVYHYVTLPFIKKVRQISFLCGSAEAVRKSTLVRLGGWDSGNLTEDIEYSIRMLNSGYKAVYLPDLTCDSEVPYTPKDLYKQQMRWAYGVIYSIKKHFKKILFNHQTTLKDKTCVGIVVGGYLLAVSLAGLFSFGFLSLITHPPEPINWSILIYETLRNIIITSGLLISSIVATIQSENSRKLLPMIVSSFSYGLITTYYVNKGIFKAILGRPMHWFMLNKKGNELVGN